MPIDYELRAARARQAAMLGHEYVKPQPLAKPESMTHAQRAAQRAIDRETKKKYEEHVLWQIAQRIMRDVGDCVPDGDPIDMLAPFVRRVAQCTEWDVRKWLNKACRKHLDCRSYDRYLIEAWDGWNEVCEPDQRMDNPWRPSK